MNKNHPPHATSRRQCLGRAGALTAATNAAGAVGPENAFTPLRGANARP
jgi:hypothetical protein